MGMASGRESQIQTRTRRCKNIAKQLTVQEVAANTPVTQPGFWEQYWPIIVGSLVTIIILGIIGYIIYKILKGLFGKEDVVEEKKQNLIAISRNLARPRYFKSFLSPHKNAPIKLFWYDKDGNIRTRFWGWYMGDMIHESGFKVISFTNKPIHWLLWFVPKVEPIFLLTTEKVNYLESYDTKARKATIKIIENLPHNLDVFNDDEILIRAVSLCEEKGFYKPVVESVDGSTINQTIAMFQLVKDMVVTEHLYHTTNAFVDNSKRAYEMNTEAQHTRKMKDTGEVNTTQP